MIEICYHGGLGERMFQYCFGRILAERWSYRLKALPLPWFPATREKVEGESVFSPVIPWKGDWPQEAVTGRRILPMDLHERPGVKIVLDGRFRRVDLIEEAADRIRNDWLRPFWESRPPANNHSAAVSDHDLVVSVRPGACQTGLTAGCLTQEEIRHLAASVPHERLVILTDNPEHSLVASVRDVADAVLNLPAIDHFRTLSGSRKVAFGQNWLDWWATFLAQSMMENYSPNN